MKNESFETEDLKNRNEKETLVKRGEAKDGRY